MNYKSLSKEQKKKFKEICDKKYGVTVVKNQSGEPLYFDEKCNIIDTKPILNLLLTNKN